MMMNNFILSRTYQPPTPNLEPRALEDVSDLLVADSAYQQARCSQTALILTVEG